MTRIKSLAETGRGEGAKTRSARPGQRALLVFHLGGSGYALPLHEIQEIVPMAWLSRPPGSPSVVAGLLNLGGKAVPVIRLDRLFELPDLVPTLYTPLVILRHPDYQ